MPTVRPSPPPAPPPNQPQGAIKFASALAEAAAGTAAGAVTLQLPEQRLLSSVVAHRGPKSLTRAAADLDLVAAFSAALAGWCSALEGLLADSELAGKDAEDAGECCCCRGCCCCEGQAALGA